MQQPSTKEYIPQPVKEVLDVFSDSLAGVEFPDVTQDTLVSLADQVDQRQQELEAAQNTLEQAQQALLASQTELLENAKRGLAYALVYAHGNTDLSQRLQTINFQRKAAGKKAKSNNKPKKNKKIDQPTKQPQVALDASDQKG